MGSQKHRRRHPSSSGSKYRGEYSLDIAQSAISTDPVFGTTGGAFVALSDLLGNDQYYFLLYNTAQTQDELLSSFNIAISRISLRQRTSYAYGIYRFTGRRYDLTDTDEFYYERVFGGYFAMSYPLTKFERIETGVSLSNSNREVDGAIEERKALLLSNLDLVHARQLPLGTERSAGRQPVQPDARLHHPTSSTPTSTTSPSSPTTGTTSGSSTRSAFASRFWLFYNHGKESRRFVMGGSWDLRGYPRWSIRGEKLWLTSHELRFPFIDELRHPVPGLWD